MDDVLTRLGAVESDLSTIKVDVSAIKAQIPYLATKSEVSDAKNSIIQWAVGTTIAATAAAGGLAFTIAKFVH